MRQGPERLADGAADGHEADLDADEEKEKPRRRDDRSDHDIDDLLAGQFQQQRLENKEEPGQRQHGFGDARRSYAELGEQPIDAHRSNIPTPIMTKMGPTEANPKSPKPSEMAERPARTELNPMAMEMMTGAVNTPVVTLPAS